MTTSNPETDSPDILSCRCGAFKWHRRYAFVGVRRETNPFGGECVVFNNPCPVCLTGPNGESFTQEDLEEMRLKFHDECAKSPTSHRIEVELQ